MQLLNAPIDRANLPDDVEALKDLLVQAGAAFQALRQQANAQMALVAAQLAEFKRKVFGPRGEALSMLQPELWHEAVQIPVPPEAVDEVKSHKRRRGGRPAIDADLPRRRIEHDLSDEDKAGFTRVVRIGEEISEMRLPLISVALSALVRRPFSAAPPTSVARTASDSRSPEWSEGGCGCRTPSS